VGYEVHFGTTFEFGTFQRVSYGRVAQLFNRRSAGRIINVLNAKSGFLQGSFHLTHTGLGTAEPMQKHHAILRLETYCRYQHHNRNHQPTHT
jgi:hypothetical protein